MISEKSLKLFSFPVRVGCFVNCFPYKWNTVSKMLARPKTHRWYWISLCNIVGQLIFLLCISTHPLQGEINQDQLIRFGYPFFFTLIVGTGQVHMLVAYEENFGFLNSLLTLNKKLGGGKKGAKDGTEWFLVSGNVMLLLTIVFCYPLFIGMIKFNIPPFLVFNTGRWATILLISLWLTYLTILNMIFICFYAYMALFYVHSTAVGLRDTWWSENCDDQEAEKRRLLFRTYQYLNKIALECFREIIAAMVFNGSGFMIVSLYSMIVFFEEFNPMYFGAVVGIFVAMKILLQLVCAVTVNSIEFPTSYRRAATTGSRVGKYEKRFFRSCPPLVICIGAFTRITEHTFTAIMNGFIFQTVVDLLLT